MVGDQLGEESAIDAPRHIVPPGNREKGSGVVIETYSIVEARRLRDVLAKTRHALRTVVKPPRRSQSQARIMPGQRSQFAAVGRFIQREKNDRQVALIAELIEQRTKSVHIICRGRDVGSPAAAALFIQLAIVLMRRARVNLQAQAT